MPRRRAVTPTAGQVAERRARLQRQAARACTTAIALGQRPRVLCVHPNDARLVADVAKTLGLAVRTTAAIPPGELCLLEICKPRPNRVGN